MNVRELKQAAQSAGATVEEDSAGRWVVWQVVAPKGQVWLSSGGKHIKVEYPIKDVVSRHAAIVDARARIFCGVRSATPQELIELDEDNS